jgi:hypothetical protein
MLLLFLFVFAFVRQVDTTISINFYTYIQQKFGSTIAEQLVRNDFGFFGSYGGGTHQSGTKTKYISSCLRQ